MDLDIVCSHLVFYLSVTLLSEVKSRPVVHSIGSVLVCINWTTSLFVLEVCSSTWDTFGYDSIRCTITKRTYA